MLPYFFSFISFPSILSIKKPLQRFVEVGKLRVSISVFGDSHIPIQVYASTPRLIEIHNFNCNSQLLLLLLVLPLFRVIFRALPLCPSSVMRRRFRVASLHAVPFVIDKQSGNAQTRSICRSLPTVKYAHNARA